MPRTTRDIAIADACGSVNAYAVHAKNVVIIQASSDLSIEKPNTYYHTIRDSIRVPGKKKQIINAPPSGG